VADIKPSKLWELNPHQRALLIRSLQADQDAGSDDEEYLTGLDILLEALGAEGHEFT
jgi:hypothetical protein